MAGGLAWRCFRKEELAELRGKQEGISAQGSLLHEPTAAAILAVRWVVKAQRLLTKVVEDAGLLVLDVLVGHRLA